MRRSITRRQPVQLPVATADSGKLIGAALAGLAAIWRDGYRYKKAGVMLLDLHPAAAVQGGLFDRPDDARRIALCARSISSTAASAAIPSPSPPPACGRPWKLQREFLSPRYTTAWDELLRVRMDSSIKEHKSTEWRPRRRHWRQSRTLASLKNSRRRIAHCQPYLSGTIPRGCQCAREDGRAVQRSIHLRGEVESVVQQLGGTCELTRAPDSGAAKSLDLCRATKSPAGCHAVVRSVPRSAQRDPRPTPG